MISFGFSARHWQQIEAGRPISMTTLLRICETFHISVERLVRRLDRGISRAEARLKASGETPRATSRTSRLTARTHRMAQDLVRIPGEVVDSRGDLTGNTAPLRMAGTRAAGLRPGACICQAPTFRKLLNLHSNKSPIVC